MMDKNGTGLFVLCLFPRFDCFVSFFLSLLSLTIFFSHHEYFGITERCNQAKALRQQMEEENKENKLGDDEDADDDEDVVLDHFVRKGCSK